MSTTIHVTKPGTGYQRTDGRYADTEAIEPLPSQSFGSGQTIGDVWDIGCAEALRLSCEVSAKSGTNPTLNVSMQTSKDGSTAWRSLGAFAQKTDVGLAMGAVTSAGTTPPAITLSGTPAEHIDLRIECTTLGARGVAVIRYSTDGGVTWTSDVTTAATILLLNSAGVSTGVTAAYANAAAAVDNVWTAKSAGREHKVFSGCDRYVRAAAQVAGTDTPTFTASVTGETC